MIHVRKRGLGIRCMMRRVALAGKPENKQVREVWVIFNNQDSLSG